MKRFLFISLVVCCLIAIVPLTVVAQEGGCTDVAYHEGLVFGGVGGNNIGLYRYEIWGRKTVDGDWAESQLHVFISGPTVWDPVNLELILGVRVDDWVTLEGDPDWLEVSCDLGWAGLDTVVEVYDQTSDSYLPLEIHVDLYGKTGNYDYDGSMYFVRDAKPYGTIDMPGFSYSISYADGPVPPGHIRAGGQNFSTQWRGF